MTDQDGAFICGDHDTRATSYSYPTSHNAKVAARAKSAEVIELLARSILMAEMNQRIGAEHEAEYDARNWRRLNSEMEG
jgi:transposase-like protein